MCARARAPVYAFFRLLVIMKYENILIAVIVVFLSEIKSWV